MTPHRATLGLIVVAHPDDDVIFAGPYQLANPWMEWLVVCATHDADDERGREMVAWQTDIGGRALFLGFPDDPRDYKRKASSFSPEELRERLDALELMPDLILTHDPAGEYGHPHHVTVSKAVLGMCPGIPKLTFAHFLKSQGFKVQVASFVKRAMAAYPSQRKVIRYHHLTRQCCRVGWYRQADDRR